MQKRVHRDVLVTAALTFLLLSGMAIADANNVGKQTEPNTAEKHVRLLVIGNSFDQPVLFLRCLVAEKETFKPIAPGPGRRLTSARAQINGSHIEMHVKAAMAFEENPDDPKGRPYVKKASLKELLLQERWDYVTFQQLSGCSMRIETYRPWAKQLYDYIKKYAPQAEVLIHQTWAWRDDEPRFRREPRKLWVVRGMLTADKMYRLLRINYDTIAEELGCRIIPVGDAFRRVKLEPGWEFDPKWADIDPKAFVPPALPERPSRSLHKGWKWMTNRKPPALACDTHHASHAGAYLGACVWFEFLFQESVVGNPYAPKDISDQDAAFLQRIAHEVVTEGKRPPLPEAPEPGEAPAGAQ
jgi:hypothetical protein